MACRPTYFFANITLIIKLSVPAGAGGDSKEQTPIETFIRGSSGLAKDFSKMSEVLSFKPRHSTRQNEKCSTGSNGLCCDVRVI